MSTEAIKTEVDSLLELVDHLKGELARVESESLRLVGAIIHSAGGTVTVPAGSLWDSYEVTRQSLPATASLRISARKSNRAGSE